MGRFIDSAFQASIGAPTETIALTIGATAAAAGHLHRQSQDQRILDKQARYTITKRGRKIVTTIRHHNVLLFTPGFPRDAIIRSLYNGALSIQNGNWDNLSQIEPDTSIKSVFRQYGPRVVVAALIIATAFVIPSINGLIPSDQVGYVRATLLVAAFFALMVSDTSKLRETALGLTKDALKPGKD